MSLQMNHPTTANHYRVFPNIGGERPRIARRQRVSYVLVSRMLAWTVLLIPSLVDQSLGLSISYQELKSQRAKALD